MDKEQYIKEFRILVIKYLNADKKRPDGCYCSYQYNRYLNFRREMLSSQLFIPLDVYLIENDIVKKYRKFEEL